MELFYILLILLVVTRALAELAERLGQPSLVGELIAGIALGAIVAQYPSTIPEMVGLSKNPVFETITDLGMFFLMLFAGVEMQPHKIIQHAKSAFVVAIGGMIIPLGIGVAVGWYFLPETELRVVQALFIGTALAITAVPATVRILMDLGQFDTPVGQTIVSAAVFDDVMSLVLLAWLTGMMGAGAAFGFGDFIWLLNKIVLFFLLTTLLGTFLFPWGGRFMKYLKSQELELTAMLVAAFAFSVLAEMLRMHFIVGAFVAGLHFGNKTIDQESYDRVKNTLSAMTFGFLAPIFFASIGLHLDFGGLVHAPVFLAILILAAFLGKILGAGGAARLSGFPAQDAKAIGIGMSPRGAVELVIASVALKAGLFDVGADSPVVQNLFSAVVIMAVVTTVLSPVMLKYTFGAPKSAKWDK